MALWLLILFVVAIVVIIIIAPNDLDRENKENHETPSRRSQASSEGASSRAGARTIAMLILGSSSQGNHER